MIKQNFIIIVLSLILLQGCSTLPKYKTQNYKGTIIYFEGGSGKIARIGDRNADRKLINRCSNYFHLAGFEIVFKEFNFQSTMDRITKEHFNTIQMKVFNLISSGHRNIWLMGISNGGISVMYAGGRQIKGVEGLILINSAGVRNDRLKEISLPLLYISHERDGLFPGYTPKNFQSICLNSIRPQLSIFKGGIIGSSVEATRATQKYQHGLRGLSKITPFAVLIKRSDSFNFFIENLSSEACKISGSISV